MPTRLARLPGGARLKHKPVPCGRLSSRLSSSSLLTNYAMLISLAFRTFSHSLFSSFQRTCSSSFRAQTSEIKFQLTAAHKATRLFVAIDQRRHCRHLAAQNAIKCQRSALWRTLNETLVVALISCCRRKHQGRLYKRLRLAKSLVSDGETRHRVQRQHLPA